MEHLNLITSVASGVKEATVSEYSSTSVERYVVTFNSLILDRASAGAGTGAIWDSALFECSVQSEASYFLVVHGFYEEASALLRMLLEGFLTRTYWHIRHKRGEVNDYFEDDKWTNDYAKWVMGRVDEYPRTKEVWNTILSEPHFGTYNQKYNLRADVERVLNALNKYVHGRPTTRYQAGTGRSSSVNIRYNSKHFDEWFDNLRAVVGLVFVICLLEYPALLATKTAVEFTSLEPGQAAHVRDVVTLPSHVSTS